MILLATSRHGLRFTVTESEQQSITEFCKRLREQTAHLSASQRLREFKSALLNLSDRERELAEFMLLEGRSQGAEEERKRPPQPLWTRILGYTLGALTVIAVIAVGLLDFANVIDSKTDVPQILIIGISFAGAISFFAVGSEAVASTKAGSKIAEKLPIDFKMTGSAAIFVILYLIISNY